MLLKKPQLLNNHELLGVLYIGHDWWRWYGGNETGNNSSGISQTDFIKPMLDYSVNDIIVIFTGGDEITWTTSGLF